MNRYLSKFAAATILGLASLSASSSTNVFTGTLALPNGVAISHEGPQSSATYRPVVQAQRLVMSAVRSTLEPKIKDLMQAASGAVPNSAGASVNGPIHLQLINGVASFSGLKAIGWVTVRQQKFGVSVNCDIQALVNPQTRIKGTIDPYSGYFTFATIENFSITPSYNCDTSLDWVPLVNLAVSALVDHFADQLIASALRSAYNSLGDVSKLAPIRLMGLDSVPNGLFTVNGVDHWPTFKTDLANAFWAVNLNMTIGDPKHYITGPTGYAPVARSSDPIFTISFNGYHFQLWDNRTYVNEVFCPNTRTQPYCYFF